MQSKTNERMPKILSPGLRLFFGFWVSIIALFVIAGAVSVPFFFESSSILYKFGSDRQLLRSGQVVGVVAGCLLLLQIILGARLKCLDRIFGLSNLFKSHRISAIIIACLVSIHPILIFISDDRFSIPLQFRYWPEFVGLFLLLLIMFMVISSHWRVELRFAFHRWWPVHRGVAILAVIALGVHVLSVNDTFEQKLPRTLAIGALVLCGLLFIWIRTRPLRSRRKPFLISAIEPAGIDAICLKIVSNTNPIPAYIAGQFGFITILAPHVSNEEHPFTIASSPTRPACLEFIIRTTGDWTRQLKNLQPQDRVLINGPFGLFSHLRLSEKKEIVMIAGGIGITPMLSMLRYMADHNDQRKITLIWSNRTQKHIFFPHEFQNLAAQLKSLRIVHVLTRAPEYTAEKGRLDRPRLKRILSACSLSSAIFVCGPDQMMKEVYNSLITIGFRRRMIFMERFSL
jgi:predicted ferric reductase